MIINAVAVNKPGLRLEPFTYKLGSLKPDEIDIDVEYCGICRSDLHMLTNDWGITRYPFVPGHEIVGKVAAIGKYGNTLKYWSKSWCRMAIKVVSNMFSMFEWTS